MNIMRVCQKCGEINKLEENSIFRVNGTTEDGETYRLMYFVCARCNTKSFVQVDSVRTLSIFNELEELINSTMKSRIKGQTISPKIIRKKDKLVKSLNRERKILEDTLSGKKMIGKDEEILTKSLTFIKDGDIIEGNL